MFSYIKLIGSDPIELVKNSVKAIKATRDKNKLIETSEIVSDGLRAEIETIFGIVIPSSVEGFNFVYDTVQYTSPLANGKCNPTMTVYVGPKEEIDRITSEIDQFWMGYVGKYQMGTLCGFVSDEALEKHNSEEFFAFIQNYTRLITHEEHLKPTPWELYNRFCHFLSCILYSHYDDELELYTHMAFNKLSYTGVTASSFSTAELNRMGNELKKLCRNPDYTKIMGFLIKTIREKSREIS